MRDFTKVSPKIWRNRSFKTLGTDEARLLMLYLMTSEHQNIAGCFRLPQGYAIDDLGWSAEKYRESLEALIEAGLVLADAETLEVFVCGWFEQNAATNKKHALGIERVIDAIESDTLRETVQGEFDASNAFLGKVEEQRASNILGMTDRLTSTGYMNGRVR